jgi:anti-sigma factor ChrR (cupin superfamily)
MTSPSGNHAQHDVELLSLYALEALPSGDVRALEAQVATCAECRKELESLRRVVASFVSWPTDVLRASGALRDRLAQRIAGDERVEVQLPHADEWKEPEWQEVAPGLSCKLLSTDTERARVSLLVRLAPGTDYPPHTHAGVEELHLLDGELWIDDRKLYPGDYNRAEQGTSDARVWSETGCTCVLITSTRDTLR